MSEMKKLTELFSAGKMNRREFMQRAAAAGIMSVVPFAMSSIPAKAAGPNKGGRLRMGLTNASTADSFDPATACCASWEICITFQTRNCMVEIDNKGRPIPELAESWETNDSATRWVFKLRKGVEFHNGKTMDAKDVVYSINHHRAEESKSPAKPLLSSVKSIQADGKYSVIFDMHDGYALLPALLSDYHLQIVPDEYSTWMDGLGTGGYRLVEFEPGVRSMTKRNPNYWKTGRAHFDEIECIGIHDTNTRINALKAGEVDIIDQPELRTVHLLGKTKGLQVMRVTGLRHYTIPMLTDVKPYDDNNVRLALKNAIDREELLKTILNGYGSIGNDHPIAPIMRYHASGIPTRSYDPDKAAHYLKKAGLSGHTFKLHAADAAFAGAVDTAILIRESAAKAGIDVQVVREPDDGYWTNVWRKKPWCFCYWSGRVTEDMMFSTAYAADGSWNDTHWQNERFNTLLKTARKELDDAKRREIYVEMQQVVRDDGGTIVPLFADHVMAATDRLRFEEPLAGHVELDGGRGTEKWWFAS